MTRYHLKHNQQIPFTAEEEAARDIEEKIWEDGKFDRGIARLRQERTSLLAATDFYALSDVTMSDEMETYRQALRDLPAGLSTVEDVNNVTYPTKP